MKLNTTIVASTIACSMVFGLTVPAGMGTAVERDRVVDRAVEQCSRESMMQVDLERESRQFEVDVEIYAAPRERWTVTVGTSGRVIHTFTRTTNREGELNGWRYLPASNRTIEVKATAADGETCRVKVRG